MAGHLEFVHSLSRPASTHIQHHRHGCHEMVYYLSGTGQTTIDGTSWHYRADDVSIQLAGTPHDERHEADTDVIFLGFHADPEPYGLAAGVFAVPSPYRIRLLLEEMRAEMNARRPLYVQKLEALLQVLLVEAARLCDGTGLPRGAADGLAHAERFLREHYAQETDYAELAAQTGYSYDRFRHLFRQQYGVPPHRHVFRLRLARACEMLLSDRRPIAAVAQDVGFSSESHFIALFRREFGCTPGAYRSTGGHVQAASPRVDAALHNPSPTADRHAAPESTP